VSLWLKYSFWHHLLLWAAAMLAAYRLRERMNAELRWFAIGLPLIGLISVPACYLMLETWKWSLIPQLQPARAVLFGTVFAGMLGSAAGIEAVRRARYVEAVAWFLLVFAIPSQTQTLIALARMTFPGAGVRLAVALGLACLAAGAVWAFYRLKGPGALAVVLAAAAVPFFAIPRLGGVQNYPQMHSNELNDIPVSRAWAGSATGDLPVPRNAGAVHGLEGGRADELPARLRARVGRTVESDDGPVRAGRGGFEEIRDLGRRLRDRGKGEALAGDRGQL
jgi:hypothetical protein